MIDHRALMFTACRDSQRRIGDTGTVIKRKGCGGRVMWGPAEPQWIDQLGFVGVCTHCGTQWFTSELSVAAEAKEARLSPTGWRTNGYRRHAA